MRTRAVVGNWKLHGSLAGNSALLAGLKDGIARQQAGATRKAGVELAVCVPYPYLAQVQSLLEGSAIAWGAQDASRFDKGAYTGEVGAAMVKEFGARYCLVGHSERRTVFGDTDAIVAEKFAAVKKAGLTPIFCLGETLQERERGETFAVLERQLGAVPGLLGKSGFEGSIVAYEPVWAIGTGRTATSAQAQEAHAFIRKRAAGYDAAVASGLTILYGGSVKGSNAAELFAMPDVDGGLVGGASLVADEFLAIRQAAVAAVER